LFELKTYFLVLLVDTLASTHGSSRAESRSESKLKHIGASKQFLGKCIEKLAGQEKHKALKGERKI